MPWGWHAGDWWMMGIGLLFWLALAGIGVWIFLRVGDRARGEPRESAEELLRRRFAAGEIDHEEYERRLEVLRRR
jgi:putative membrane protein